MMVFSRSFSFLWFTCLGATRFSVTGQTTNATATVPADEWTCPAPSIADDPNKLFLGGIIDTTAFTWIPDIFEYTVQLINQGGWRDDVLQGFGPDEGDLKLSYAIGNSECSESAAVRRYWELRTQNQNIPPHGIIGARCSEASIALAHTSGLECVPMLSPSSGTAQFSSSPDEFPFFSRMVAPDNERGGVGALIALLRAFEWERVRILATDTEYATDMVNEFQKLWVGEHGSWTGSADSHTLRRDIRDPTRKKMDREFVERTLQAIPKDSRIILLVAHAEHAYEILKIAQDINFQPDTVWVGPSSWVDRMDGDVAELEKKLPNYPGYLGIAPFRNRDDPIYKDYLSGLQKWQGSLNKTVLEDLPPFASETVDAIIVMAKALSETPANQRRVGSVVVDRLRSIAINGVSGRVEFDPTTGDRKNPMYSIYNARSETGKLVWEKVGDVGIVVGSAEMSFDNVCFAQFGCGAENTPLDTYPEAKVPLPPWVMAVLAILSLLFLALAFKYWRSRKSKNSIKAELMAFQNSIVDMKAASCNYIPHGVVTKATVHDDSESTTSGVDSCPKKAQSLTAISVIPPPVVRWCWKESVCQSGTLMQQHDVSAIYGDPADCWILYNAEQSRQLEAAYLKRAAECSPMPGYRIDLKKMIQTKQATGFQRPVCRHVERQDGGNVPGAAHPVTQQQPEQHLQPTHHDLSNVTVGVALPSDLQDEPQMVLVQGDVIQISKKRDDGWAFGTKLHHADEEAERQLVRAATERVGAIDGDEANVFPDSGWFPMTSTRTPSVEELKALRQKVASGTLDSPKHWAPTKDATAAERHVLYEGDLERSALLLTFLSTLSNKIQILRVERIQNKAMFQSYVVKRQTICYRETGDDDDVTVQQKALQRFERRWLWHGTNAEVVNKIMNQVGTGKWMGRGTKRMAHNNLRAKCSGINRGLIGVLPGKTPRRMAREFTLPATRPIRPVARTVSRTGPDISTFSPAVCASGNTVPARQMP
jgi:ABC-type branched-subunit amino acid transport system substrate-binding protein